VDIEKLIGQAEYDTTFTLGPCAICGTATYCGARIPRSSDFWTGKRFVYLCFREHRNEAGLRQALNDEVKEERC
jgi:hypothetical protein